MAPLHGRNDRLWVAARASFSILYSTIAIQMGSVRELKYSHKILAANLRVGMEEVGTSVAFWRRAMDGSEGVCVSMISLAVSYLISAG
jgi:hypothetical protein